MNLTDKGRVAARVAFFLVVVAAVFGWFLDKNPAELSSVIGWLTAAVLGGEAAECLKIGAGTSWDCSH